ncbi:antitoxin Xre/MbcA/ParS toxin-binding domain-containing protein [Nevskia soli]|uniref:antitoxin Xre/MbcA/ParS toxin-binding domain-containing protein n=1 Tax=Nevskia soli TaxID=418856 RepID=UPI0015D7CD1C
MPQSELRDKSRHKHIWPCSESATYRWQGLERRTSCACKARQVFANQEKAIHWLRSPNPSLAGKTPLEAAQTDQGYREVEDVLVRIEHGVLG